MRLRVFVVGHRRQQGFGYLWLLFAVAVLGVGLSVVGQVWHTAVQRDREADLIYVGQQYKKAIKAYRDHTPGGGKEYPRSLDDLLLDHRVPHVARYLRRIYPDPISKSTEWGLVKQGDRVIGVYSPSVAEPRKKTGFPKGLASFEDKSHYSDWKFVVGEDEADADKNGQTAAPTGKAGP